MKVKTLIKLLKKQNMKGDIFIQYGNDLHYSKRIKLHKYKNDNNTYIDILVEEGKEFISIQV